METDYSFSTYAPNDQDPISLIFTKCHDELKETRKLREELRHWSQEIERLTDILKSVITEVHSVHFRVEKVTEKAAAVLYDLQDLFQRLETQVFGSTEEVSYIWQRFLSKLASSCILLKYVQTGELASKAEVAAMIGIGASIEADVRIFLDVESYLLGMLDISDELTRYAILGTGLGKLDRPRKVGEFLNKLYQGFTRIEKTEKMYQKMIRFDNDLKRLERVMFEMAIRNVGKEPLSIPQQPSAPMLPSGFQDLNIGEVNQDQAAIQSSGGSSVPVSDADSQIHVGMNGETDSDTGVIVLYPRSSTSSFSSLSDLEPESSDLKPGNPCSQQVEELEETGKMSIIKIESVPQNPPAPVQDLLCRLGGRSSRREACGKLIPNCASIFVQRDLGMFKGVLGYNQSLNMEVIQRHVFNSRYPVPLPSTPKKRKRNSGPEPLIRKPIITTPRISAAAGPNALFMEFQKGATGGNSVVVIDDYILVRNSQDYECYAYEPKLRLMPKYNIPAGTNWKNWTVSYTPDQPLDVHIVGQFRNLFVLEGCGKLIKAFNLETGEITFEQFLDESIKFHSVDFSSERQELYVHAVKATLPPEVIFDGLVIPVGRPGSVIRWQVLKSATTASIEQTDTMLFLNSGNRVEVCDFRKTLEEAAFVPGNHVFNSSEPISVTHLVKDKPQILMAIQTKNSYFEISHAGFPPHYITSLGKDTGCFKVYDASSSSDGIVNNQELMLLDADDDTVSVTFHPDDSPRLILTGRSRLRVVSIQRRANRDGYGTNSALVEEFHVKFNGRDKPTVLNPDYWQQGLAIPAVNDRNSPSNGSTPAEGRRPVRRASLPVRNYFEDTDVLIHQEYCEPLDMLVIMEVTELDLKFYLYDNQSWSLIKALTGLNLITKRIDSIQLGIFSMSCSATQITVRRNKSDTDRTAQQLIIVPLMLENTD